MKNQNISIIFICLIGIMTLTADVNAVSCNINNCGNYISYNCSTLYLTSNITLTSSMLCISIKDQNLNMLGNHITTTLAVKTYSIFIYNSGSVYNGTISAVGSWDSRGITINDQDDIINIYDMSISVGNSQNIDYSLVLGSGLSTVNVYNSQLYSKIYVGNDLNVNSSTVSGLDIKDNSLNINLYNVSINQNRLYGIYNNNYSDININIDYSLICNNTNDLKFIGDADNVLINNNNEFYYKTISGVYSASGQPFRNCSNYTAFNFTENNITFDNTNFCDNKLYSDLSDVGLYDLNVFSLSSLSQFDKYAFKVKIQNETLYNSLNITVNRICLYKKSNSFYVCDDAEYSSYMTDTVKSNLANYDYFMLKEFKDGNLGTIGDIATAIIGITQSVQKDRIALSYCNEYNKNCGLLGCECKGYYYEFPKSHLETGDYNVYLFISDNNSQCLYRLDLDDALLDGSLKNSELPDGKDYKNTPDNMVNPKEVKKKVKLYNGFYFSPPDLCNITAYTLLNSALKSSDVIFHLTAKTNNNTYADADILDYKTAVYNAENKAYETNFDICEYNLTVDEIGVFVRIKDTDLNDYPELDNHGYIGNLNRNNETGQAINIYYYVDNTTIINYTNNISSSDNVNDRYYYDEGNTDSLFIIIIIVFIVIIVYSFIILFKSKKK